MGTVQRYKEQWIKNKEGEKGVHVETDLHGYENFMSDGEQQSYVSEKKGASLINHVNPTDYTPGGCKRKQN